MDYNVEVPFERVPEEVFPTDDSETPKPNIKLGSIGIQDIEGKMRDDEEKTRRKIDAKRLKKL